MTHIPELGRATTSRFAARFAVLRSLAKNIEERTGFAASRASDQSLNLESIMADQADLAAEVTKLAAAVTEFETREAEQNARDAATIVALNATIADLEAKGNPDTQSTIDALVAIRTSIPQAQTAA